MKGNIFRGWCHMVSFKNYELISKTANIKRFLNIIQAFSPLFSFNFVWIFIYDTLTYFFEYLLNQLKSEFTKSSASNTRSIPWTSHVRIS